MKKIFFIVFVVLLFTLPVYAAKPDQFVSIPKSVCLDPGHGGSDSGVVNQDLKEKDVNLTVATLVAEKLEKSGFTVFMTRMTDVSLSNADRYTFCNNNLAALLVSIHHNGSMDATVDYTESLYMKKSDVKPAQIVSTAVSAALGLPNHGISRFASGVLLKAQMPATISEGFFLTSSNEYALIKTGNRLETESQALFEAITSYFNP